MKKALPFSILVVFIAAGIAFGGASLQFFSAKAFHDNILVEWKTGDEGGTVRFELERSAGSPDNFIHLADINANGNNSYYSFSDKSIGAMNNPNSLYYYRLKYIEGNGGTSYSHNISVVHSVSGIRSTWGSIKAIFR